MVSVSKEKVECVTLAEDVGARRVVAELQSEFAGGCWDLGVGFSGHWGVGEALGCCWREVLDGAFLVGHILFLRFESSPILQNFLAKWLR